jgi:hypothetical protein
MALTEVTQDYRNKLGIVREHLRANLTEMIYIPTAEDRAYLRSISYDRYLLTLYWALVRVVKLNACGRTCDECGKQYKKLQIHHTTYDHMTYEYEHLDELRVLCIGCHESEHRPEEVTDLLRSLVESKKPGRIWQPKENTDYNPHALYGIARGVQ